MRPLKIWLVQHNDPFPAGAEGQQVRAGIRQRLERWFDRTVRHRNARSRPAGFRADAVVAWTDLADPGVVGDRDIVIYFSPKRVGDAARTDAAPSVERGPYCVAAQQLTDEQVRTAVLDAIRRGARAGGITRRVAVGSRLLPILSEVFVLYDAQMPRQAWRVESNVATLAAAAFHEAGHNKAPDLHEHGGGGVFSEYYSGQQINDENIAFLASHVWAWGPQYVRGQPLTPRAP